MSDKSYQGALTAYRIVRDGYPVFDGSGAARWGGRWTGKGRAVIHTAESYALAVLESLVHFNASALQLPRLLEVFRLTATLVHFASVCIIAIYFYFFVFEYPSISS